MILNPTEFYGQTQLLELGLSSVDLNNARRTGALKAYVVGGVPVFKGSDLIDWLQGNGSGPSTAPARPGTRQAAMTSNTSDPIAQWDALVASKVTAGMARHLAVREVAREHPDLKTAYIVAYNAQHAAACGRR